MSILSTQQDFSSVNQTLSVVETASSAIASQAKAMIESRYIMAMRNPRNWDQVRQDILKECRRPSFAHNPSTYYNKPIGKGVEGLGIRFTEVALRCMKNVLIETTMVFEDETKEVHRVSVTDLESNVTYPLDVRVSKTVERSKPSSDGSYISVRKNSYGKDVFTVLGSDDDLLNKRGALISKAIRTLGGRIIPGDIQDEATDIIKKIRLDSAAKDPDSERKKIVDAFASLGVKASDIVNYLGHPIDQCSPSEIVDLRGIFGAIKDGESSWKSVMENKQGEGYEDVAEIIENIRLASTKEEMDNLLNDINKLPELNQKTAKNAWTKKANSLKAKKQEQPETTTENPKPIDWPAKIKECIHTDALNSLMSGMSETELMEFTEQIDEKFDMLRGSI